MKKATLSDIQTHLVLSNGLLTASTNEIPAYGGTLKATLNTNSAGVTGIDATVSGVKADGLLSDFAGFNKLTGTLAGHIALWASGDSERAMISDSSR